MSLLFDQFGNVVGDDDLGDTFEQGANAGSQLQKDTLTPTKLGFIESKIADFQKAVLLADTTVDDIKELMLYTDDDAILQDLQNQLDEFETRRGAIKFAAESFNAVANVVNSMGGGMQSLTIPSGLGFAPVVPLAYVAAITAGIALIDWIHQWAKRTFDIGLEAASRIKNADLRDTTLQVYNQKLTDLRIADSNTFGGAIGAFKWIAIGVLGLVAYNTWKASQK